MAGAHLVGGPPTTGRQVSGRSRAGQFRCASRVRSSSAFSGVAHRSTDRPHCELDNFLGQLNDPARRISPRNARARLNSIRTCDHAALSARLQHLAQEGIDGEPGMPEVGVVHTVNLGRRSTSSPS